MTYPLFHLRHPATPPRQLSADDFTREFPGENHYVEFKQGLSETKTAEAMVAFSNADGGVILIGVGPDGRPVGVTASGELKARVHRLAARIHDPGRYELDHVVVDDKEILVLAVDRRHEGFAQAPDGRVLSRREAQNVTLIGAELSDLVSRRSLVRFETQPTATRLDRVPHPLLRRVAEAWAWTDSEDLTDRLVEKGLATRDGRAVVLTVAGSLYLLEDPAGDRRRYRVELFRYRDESTRYDHRRTFSGPLPEQVREAARVIADEIGTELVVIGTHRHEIPRVPIRVLREALANAVAHRAYEDPRRPVRVELRPGRVVVTSPGPLPEPVTVDNIRQQNAPRNIAVIDTLRRFGLAEDAGRGVDIMEDAMEAHMLARPEFVDDGTSVTVTLSTSSAVTPEERAWLLSLEEDDSLDADERRLLLLAGREGSVTNARARAKLGIDSVAARRLLSGLRDRGILVQHGSRGGALYVLDMRARTSGPSAVRNLTPAEAEAMVVELAREGAITNETVRDATGLDRATVVRILNRMVRSGTLVRRGERRGTTYELAGG